MATRRAQLRTSQRRYYERLARAALTESGELSHHVKRWKRGSRKMLKTALHRLGFRRQAVMVEIEAAT